MQSIEELNKKMAKVSKILELETSVLNSLSSREKERCVAKKFGINITKYRELKRSDTIPEELFNKYSPEATQAKENHKENINIVIDEETRLAIGIETEKLGDIVTISISGTDMSPTIKDKAIVFVDKKNTELLDAGIYVIKSNELGDSNEVFIRRLILQPNGEVDIICDNDVLKKYSHKTKLSEIEIIGKVVGAITKV